MSRRFVEIDGEQVELPAVRTCTKVTQVTPQWIYERVAGNPLAERNEEEVFAPNENVEREAVLRLERRADGKQEIPRLKRKATLTAKIIEQVAASLQPIWYAALKEEDQPEEAEVLLALTKYYKTFERNLREIVYELVGGGDTAEADLKPIRERAFEVRFAIDYAGLGISPRSIGSLLREEEAKSKGREFADKALKFIGVMIVYGGQLIPLDPHSPNTTARLVITSHGADIVGKQWRLLLPKYLDPSDASDMLGKNMKRTLYVTPDYVVECIRERALLGGCGVEHAHLRPLPYPLQLYPRQGTNGLVVHVKGFGEQEDRGLIKLLKRVGCRVGRNYEELSFLVVKRWVRKFEGLQVSHGAVKELVKGKGLLTTEEARAFRVEKPS